MVLESVNKLKTKNSVGRDNISTKLLKDIIECIIYPVTHLFNLSFRTGYIPSEYKCAKVIPIFKSGDKASFNNYRPISILPTFSKLLEKIAARQMFKYLNKFNIFYKHQYGFRPRHDTNQPIIQLMNKIYEGLNKKKSEYSLGIYLDLKKAFVTVNTEILLKKLNHYGFRNTSNTWFRNYLTNRTQFVCINGVCSLEKLLTCGVPQGSVLGPLLFLLYINDLPLATDFFTNLFADDTSFLMSSPDLDSLILSANNELAKASLWFKTNRLTLNVSKTKYMVFRNKAMPMDADKCKIKIDNEELERIGRDCKNTYFKFVGIKLDEFLTFEHHIDHVSSKIAKATFALRQIKKKFPLKIRKLVYSSLVKSHLEYGICIWGSSKCTKIKKVINLQKKAVRTVNNANFRAHCDPIFSKLELLKFDDLYKINVLSFMYNYFYSKLPLSFNGMFELLGEPNRTKSFKVEKVKNNTLESFPTAIFPRIWNSTALETKESRSKNSLKYTLSTLAYDRYKLFKCQSSRCYSCNQN